MSIFDPERIKCILAFSGFQLRVVSTEMVFSLGVNHFLTVEGEYSAVNCIQYIINK